LSKKITINTRKREKEKSGSLINHLISLSHCRAGGKRIKKRGSCGEGWGRG